MATRAKQAPDWRAAYKQELLASMHLFLVHRPPPMNTASPHSQLAVTHNRRRMATESSRRQSVGEGAVPRMGTAGGHQPRPPKLPF